MTTELHDASRNALDAVAGLVGHTTTQGIPTLYAPRQGEITAGLFFRVGRADETLATAGITHLVEHLALHRLGLTDLHYNGATANTYTLFHVTGSEEDVVTHLNSVCAALRAACSERPVGPTAERSPTGSHHPGARHAGRGWAAAILP